MTETEMSNFSNNTPSMKKRAVSGVGRGLSWSFRFSMKLVLIGLFVAIGLFFGGFLQFTNKVTSYKMTADMQPADAIVALTGGSTRIAKALDLMADKKGQRLLISGVNAETKIDDLKSINQKHGDVFDCCVDIDRAARDTIGNARETSKWVTKGNYKSLIIVTSAYHMPRSMVEFRDQMKDVKLVPYAVPLDSISREDWWKNTNTLRFMLGEYVKYVGAHIRRYLSSENFVALRSSLAFQEK